MTPGSFTFLQITPRKFSLGLLSFDSTIPRLSCPRFHIVCLTYPRSVLSILSHLSSDSPFPTPSHLSCVFYPPSASLVLCLTCHLSHLPAVSPVLCYHRHALRLISTPVSPVLCLTIVDGEIRHYATRFDYKDRLRFLRGIGIKYS